MIFFTSLAIFVMVGFQSGAYQLIEDSYTKFFNGDIQVRLQGYNDIEDFEKLLAEEDISLIQAKLELFDKTPIFSTTRYLSFALGDFNDKNFAFQLVGIEPNTEKNLSMPASHMVQGSFLDDSSYNDVVIGQDLADFFNIKVGDEIVLMTTDVYDSFVIDSFMVKGIYQTGDISLDKNTAFIHRNYFNDNIAFGDKATNITIKLTDSSYRDTLKTFLQNSLPSHLEVVSWDEVLPNIKQTIQFQFIVSMFFYVLLVVIVSFTIVNSMMLATLKRMPEFGIYSSIGLNNRYFKWILFFENFIICTVSVGLSTILGMIFIYHFSKVGIPLPAITQEEGVPLTLINNVIYPNPHSPLLLVGPILVYASTILAIIPPIIRLSKSNPVQAITSN
jgi:ABC-type lipoprotein release transport system permease subunit